MKVEENCKRERVKWKRRRGEWSGCVTDCLLDAYEDKWKSLDCGNSRRRHWEEVARHVSAQRGGRGRGDHGSKPPFQCSNKVDQMKMLKGERQRKSVLKWPHYSRLEFILQGSSQRDTASGHLFPPVLDQSSLSSEAGSLVPEEEKWQVQDEEFDVEKEDDNSSELPLQKLRPAYSLLGPISKVQRPRSTSTKDRRQQLSTSNKSNPDIVASFQSFANSILKLEEAKLEMHCDSERLLVEREARQLDLQLKHTEMLLDTQLEITKLLTTQTWK
ncbi:unnamed protein product [Sphagnum jensenii]|uniref:Myb/SANT-like DNA-binding domain-containing protein n=1 Tax=Sphagnum jensenii TaxID=128206 RepID=A0ABP0XE29_9BRYO